MPSPHPPTPCSCRTVELNWVKERGERGGEREEERGRREGGEREERGRRGREKGGKRKERGRREGGRRRMKISFYQER